MKPITNAHQAWIYRHDAFEAVRRLYEQRGATVPDHVIEDGVWRLGGWRLSPDNYTATVNGYLRPDPPPRAVATIEELEAALWPPEPPKPIEPPDTPFRRIQGRLHLGDFCYRDDTGPILPVFCHAGDLFALYVRDPEWAEAEARTIAEAGYMGVRTWTWLAGAYWERLGRTVTPIFHWEHLDRFAEMLVRVGLRWMVSMGDITRVGVRPEKWPDYMREVADALQYFGPLVVSIDCGNEAWNQVPDLDTRDLARAMDAFLDVFPVSIRSLTDSPEANLSRYHADPATVFDVHGYRGGHYWDKIRHIFSLQWEGRPPKRLGIQSEPCGPGKLVSVTEHQNELTDEVMGLMCAQSLMCDQWFVYMSSPGVSIRERGEFTRQPGFSSVPKVANALPPDLMRWGKLSHGGESQKGTRIFVASPEKDGVRCDQVVQTHGNRCMVVVYGPRHGRPITEERPVQGRWLLPTGDMGSEYRRGQAVGDDRRPGAIFLGEVLD